MTATHRFRNTFKKELPVEFSNRISYDAYPSIPYTIEFVSDRAVQTQKVDKIDKHTLRITVGTE